MRFHLLIVDDDPRVCETLATSARELYGEEKIEVATATRPERASEMLASLPTGPVLLLTALDLHHPVLDGLDVIATAKAAGVRGTILTLSPGREPPARLDGFSAHLTKPIKARELHAAIERALAAARA